MIDFELYTIFWKSKLMITFTKLPSLIYSKELMFK